MLDPEEPTPLARTADRVALGLLAIASVFILAQLLDFAHGRDQAIFAVVADHMLAGGAPYSGAWDFKTPGIYGVYALAQGLFGSTVQAIRILEVGAILATAAAFLVLSRRALSSCGLGLAGGLAGTFVALLTWVELEFWHTAQPESFAVPVLAWALVAATRPAQAHRAALAWASAGALFCTAGLLKPPLGGGILTSMALTLLAVRPRWKPLAAYAAGASAVLLLTLLWLTAKGAQGAAYRTLFVWTPHYTGIDFGGPPPLQSMGTAIYRWLVGFSPFHAPGLALWIVLRGRSAGERTIALHLAGVLAMGLVGIVLQNKFFEYHFGAVMPLTGLLAGWGYARAWSRLRGKPLGLAVASAGIAAILIGLVPTTNKGPGELWHRCAVRARLWQDPGGTQELRDELYSFPGSPAGPRRLVAEWIRSHTREVDSIFVWGFEPGIYQQAGRRPASRYIYNVPQRVEWEAGAARAALLADLAASPPAAVVIQSGDALPWVTNNDEDSRSALTGFPELEAWLRADYASAKTIGPFEILIPAANQ